jgi:hypothetical protein
MAGMEGCSFNYLLDSVVVYRDDRIL